MPAYHDGQKNRNEQMIAVLFLQCFLLGFLEQRLTIYGAKVIAQ